MKLICKYIFDRSYSLRSGTSLLSRNHRKRWLNGLLLLCAWSTCIPSVQAEGSRDLYPVGITGNRAVTEWRSDTYGPPSSSILRRTLLQVYAKQNEYILLGSSAMGVGLADIEVFGSKTGPIGHETLSASRLKCSKQRTTTGIANQGLINSRTQELAGPNTIPSGGVLNGYIPCYYQAPSDGIYYVALYGTAGDNSTSQSGTITSSINFDYSTGTKEPAGTSVTAWDVTVRDNLTSTTNNQGRLFSDYLTLFTNGNGLPVNSKFYILTSDGYQYQTSLNGLDPNGFVIYGNDIGYFDSDGKTPLYHDVLGDSGSLSALQGGVSLGLPSHAIFFNQTPANEALSARGISLTPIAPTISNVQFVGTAGGNTSKQNTGGNFSFNSNLGGIYEITISQDGTFDPTQTINRVLRGKITSSSSTISWDGKDNSGNFFPVGKNYPFHLTIHAGEYHFPLIDAENSTLGGPSFRLINATNPLGQSTGFYDDRGYRTSSGKIVGTVNKELCGINPPTIPNSDPIKGFDTTTTQRAYGQSNGGNTNVSCTGSFGDAKGLDIWTYVPSQVTASVLNIIAPTNANLLLVKRITRINNQTIYNNQDLTQFVDGRSDVSPNASNYVASPHDTDDNDPNWPAGYLRGSINPGTLKPGDDLEYTIYFLSKGPNPAIKVKLCDLVPVNSTFVPTAFNGLSPNDGGLSTSDQGIALAIGSTAPTAYLSNVADTDRGVFYSANDSSTPAYCTSNIQAPNTNGAVEVTISNIPAATGSGTPNNSYGFIRFHAKVK